MAGWYVRRGEKVVGPVDVSRMKELAGEGKLLPTDQLAKDAAGPWSEASRTSLFPKEPVPEVLGPQAQSEPALQHSPLAILPAVEHFPTQYGPSESSNTGRVAKTSLAVVKNVGRSFLVTGGAISQWLSVSSQRRHELKLAKIQAKALADSQRIQTAHPTAPPPPIPAAVTIAPRLVQTTVVKVVNRNSGGCGCSGCGLILLLIVLGLIAIAVYSEMNQSPP